MTTSQGAPRCSAEVSLSVLGGSITFLQAEVSLSCNEHHVPLEGLEACGGGICEGRRDEGDEEAGTDVLGLADLLEGTIECQSRCDAQSQDHHAGNVEACTVLGLGAADAADGAEVVVVDGEGIPAARL